jgi:hypothetical protein
MKIRKIVVQLLLDSNVAKASSAVPPQAARAGPGGTQIRQGRGNEDDLLFLEAGKK